MKFLLLIAHGSRRQEANDEIERLAQRIAALDDCEYDEVISAFLECAQPDIHQGIARCVERGARHIVVMPYFLAGGKHVNKDVPGEVACASAGQPEIKIEYARYIGASDALPALVLDSARVMA